MEFDVLVVGAGIAGAAAAYALLEVEPGLRLVVVEREEAPGYHATGRSAAFFVETYGGPVVRALTRGSRGFLESPPQGFSDQPLLTPRGALHVARADQREAAEALYEQCRQLTPDIAMLDAGRVREMQPALRPGYAVCGVLEPDARDIDVHAVHQGYLHGMRARGGQLMTNADVLALQRSHGGWWVETRAGPITATTVIDAAGAWADAVAGLAGLPPLGLQPMRRTALTFDPPGDMAFRGWPVTLDAWEDFYFRPEAGRILLSPADETPTPPCDVQPEDLDVALAVDRLERATVLTVERITHKWAGLRSFYPDRTPVVGMDPRAPGFVWLAGQGGYGIMTSPAMGRIAAALVLGRPIPADLADLGLTAETLAPDRLLATASPIG